jgi:hypothetical protein
LLNRSVNNTPINITDYTFTGQLRENYTTDEIAATLSFEKILPYSSGSIFIKLSQADTVNLTQRKYVYDVNISSGSSAPIVRRVLEGGFTVRPTVTR